MYHVILVLFGHGEYLSRETGWFRYSVLKKKRFLSKKVRVYVLKFADFGAKNNFKNLIANSIMRHLRKASLVAQMVKNLPSVWKTQVRCLCQDDPLEKEMATHSSILAWRIPWTEEPGGNSPWGRRVRHFHFQQSMGSKSQTLSLSLHFTKNRL